MRSGLRDYTLFERLAVALSLFALSILLIDPFILERAYKLPPGARAFFRTITDIGLSNWMLIPTGAAAALAIVLWRNHTNFRKSASYGLIASTIGFEFVSVGGAGLIAALFKNSLGRARPKLYDTVGHFEFQLFSFDPDYASIPSGHATNIFAFATVIALLWPRGRLLLYTIAAWIAASRVFIGVHYFTDAVLGAMLGTATSCGRGLRRGAGCSSAAPTAATAFAAPERKPGLAGPNVCAWRCIGHRWPVAAASRESRSANLLIGIGGRTRIRTLDPLIKSQLLYQLSYAPDRHPCQMRHRYGCWGMRNRTDLLAPPRASCLERRCDKHPSHRNYFRFRNRANGPKSASDAGGSRRMPLRGPPGTSI